MFLHNIFRAMPLAVLVVSTAAAQTKIDAAPSETSATPVVSGLQYQSTFADYVPYSEEAVESWRNANETVEKIGGWRAYAKDAHRPESAPLITNPNALSTQSSNTVGDEK